MRRKAVLLLTLVSAVQGPALAQDTGRVEGIATIATRLTRPPLRVRVYEEPGALPVPPPADSNPFAGVVLYLESVTPIRGRPPAGAVPSMRQYGERFAPHVLPVMTGTTVEFPNDDPIYHNVFSLSRVRTFDLGRYPRGQSKSVTFTRSGVVQVFCHIHADMSGFILVLDSPFFVVPDAQGRFAIAGVPPGDYQLVAWHERIHPLLTPVHVDAGRTATLQLRIPLADSGAVR